MENVAHDRFLPGPEGIEAESLFEGGQQVVVHRVKDNLYSPREPPPFFDACPTR